MQTVGYNLNIQYQEYFKYKLVNFYHNAFKPFCGKLKIQVLIAKSNY